MVGGMVYVMRGGESFAASSPLVPCYGFEFGWWALKMCSSLTEFVPSVHGRVAPAKLVCACAQNSKSVEHARSFGGERDADVGGVVCLWSFTLTRHRLSHLRAGPAFPTATCLPTAALFHDRPAPVDPSASTIPCSARISIPQLHHILSQYVLHHPPQACAQDLRAKPPKHALAAEDRGHHQCLRSATAGQGLDSAMGDRQLTAALRRCHRQQGICIRGPRPAGPDRRVLDEAGARAPRRNLQAVDPPRLLVSPGRGTRRDHT